MAGPYRRSRPTTLGLLHARHRTPVQVTQELARIYRLLAQRQAQIDELIEATEPDPSDPEFIPNPLAYPAHVVRIARVEVDHLFEPDNPPGVFEVRDTVVLTFAPRTTCIVWDATFQHVAGNTEGGFELWTDQWARSFYDPNDPETIPPGGFGTPVHDPHHYHWDVAADPVTGAQLHDRRWWNTGETEAEMILRLMVDEPALASYCLQGLLTVEYTVLARDTFDVDPCPAL